MDTNTVRVVYKKAYIQKLSVAFGKIIWGKQGKDSSVRICTDCYNRGLLLFKNRIGYSYMFVYVWLQQYTNSG